MPYRLAKIIIKYIEIEISEKIQKGITQFLVKDEGPGFSKRTSPAKYF